MFGLVDHKVPPIARKPGNPLRSTGRGDEKPIGSDLGWSGVIGFGFLGLALIFYMVVALLPVMG